MEPILKNVLKTETLKPVSLGKTNVGCISNGSSYLTDFGTVFVKSNDENNALKMFDGEKASLEAIRATNTIRCPKPIAVVEDPNSTNVCLVTEYLDMERLSSKSQYDLGFQLAKLHNYNKEQLDISRKKANLVTSSGVNEDLDPCTTFGFSVPTSCGYISQDNTWNSSWDTFYVRNKLQQQYNLIMENYGDRHLMENWSVLISSVQSFLGKMHSVVPSLLHGDLWSGNVALVDATPGKKTYWQVYKFLAHRANSFKIGAEFLVFDPASFYGHAEYEFGIVNMFKGFGVDFFKGYHEIIPRESGFEKRVKIYELFHHLNHWNHFGSSYKSSSFKLMREIIEFSS